MSGQPSSSRLVFSAALPVLLARDIDKICAENFRDILNSMLDSLLSSRTLPYISAQRTRPEWDLLASLLFYGVSMARYGATPGMQFCGISMIKERQIGAQQINAVYSRVGSPTLLSLALLYSLEPYILSRSDEISSYLQHLASLLFDLEDLDETAVPPSPLPSATSASLQLQAIDGRQMTCGDGSDGKFSLQRTLWKYTHRIGSALSATIHSHFPSPTLMLHGFVAILNDISLFRFYRDSRFANLPLRLAGMRLYNESDGATGHQGRLRALALLLLIKFGFYSVSFARSFIAQLASQRLDSLRRVAQGDALADDSDDYDDDGTSISRLGGNNASTRQCVLCMGHLVGPAAAPCGHVYCWRCVMEMCRVAKAQGRRSSCAICRRAFNAQGVRALYSYC